MDIISPAVLAWTAQLSNSTGSLAVPIQLPSVAPLDTISLDPAVSHAALSVAMKLLASVPPMLLDVFLAHMSTMDSVTFAQMSTNMQWLAQVHLSILAAPVMLSFSVGSAQFVPRSTLAG